jgi:hypothetical protein
MADLDDVLDRLNAQQKPHCPIVFPSDCKTLGIYALDAVIKAPSILEDAPAGWMTAVRVKAQIEARIIAAAITPRDDFATRLDAAIARSDQARQSPMIEGPRRQVSGPLVVANPLPTTGPTPTKMSAPFSTLRRI